MNIKLFVETITKITIGIIVVGLLLFVPGTILYYQGWILMSILFIPKIIASFIMMIKNPTLLKRRLNNKEKIYKQKILIILSGIMFIIGFIIAGLNYRYKWMLLPDIITIISSIIFILFYILYAVVLIQNPYLLRTIEIEDNQKLIDTGLYSIVRHPMYTTTIGLFLTMPLVLASPITFIIFLLYIVIIINRLNNEEIILENNLKGYKKYKEKVKYKLIPYIW